MGWTFTRTPTAQQELHVNSNGVMSDVACNVRTGLEPEITTVFQLEATNFFTAFSGQIFGSSTNLWLVCCATQLVTLYCKVTYIHMYGRIAILRMSANQILFLSPLAPPHL